MTNQMNHEEAVQLAQEIDAKYELRCNVRDFESEEDPTLNHSYLGVWQGEHTLLFSLNDRSQWNAIRDFAYKMVQTDADLRQEEKSENYVGVPLSSEEYKRRVQEGTLGQSFLERNNLT